MSGARLLSLAACRLHGRCTLLLLLLHVTNCSRFFVYLLRLRTVQYIGTYQFFFFFFLGKGSFCCCSSSSIHFFQSLRSSKKPCVSRGPWYSTDTSDWGGKARNSIRVHPLTFPAGWDVMRVTPLDNVI